MKTFRLYRNDVYNYFETQNGGKPKFDTFYYFDLIDGRRDFDLVCELPDGWKFVECEDDFSYLLAPKKSGGFGRIGGDSLFHDKSNNAPYCYFDDKEIIIKVIEID